MSLLVSSCLPLNFRFTNLSLRTRILLVVSILSFIPQLRLLLVRRDSSGLSLYYVFLNLLVSIELVTVAAFFVVTLADVGSDTFVNEPPDTGDWINLAQLAVIFLLWLLTYVPKPRVQAKQSKDGCPSYRVQANPRFPYPGLPSPSSSPHRVVAVILLPPYPSPHSTSSSRRRRSLPTPPPRTTSTPTTRTVNGSLPSSRAHTLSS